MAAGGNASDIFCHEHTWPYLESNCTRRKKQMISRIINFALAGCGKSLARWTRDHHFGGIVPTEIEHSCRQVSDLRGSPEIGSVALNCQRIYVAGG
jgi:hypothetical protein